MIEFLWVFPTQKSIGLPDIHSGYGFAIGNTAAFDAADPLAVVSPGRPSLTLPPSLNCFDCVCACCVCVCVCVCVF